MRLKNYINESGYPKIKNLTKDQVVIAIANDSYQALDRWNKGYKIFRTTRGAKDFALTTPTGHRRSAFAAFNYYTLIMNNHPKWSPFPKREIIGAGGSGERAFSHGDVDTTYAVFPYNGAKIGICPDDDIWGSFKDLADYGIYDMDYFNRCIGELENAPSDSNWKEFEQWAKETEVEYVFYNSRIRNDFGDDISVYDFISKTMSPKRNGFSLKNTRTYNIDSTQDLEVWTDKKCILIHTSRVDEIVGEANEI